eukprot:759977-Hanusia_phi.AAC.8
MSRAGKKCLFEDDVRQLLGMPRIEDPKADTSLEKAYSVGNSKADITRQMSKLQASDEAVEVPDIPGFGARYGRKFLLPFLLLLLLVVGAAFLTGAIVQASSSTKRQQQALRGASSYHPRRNRHGRSRSRADNDDDSVVNKENWKALQAKADREAQKRSASHRQRAEMQEESNINQHGKHPGGSAIKDDLEKFAWKGQTGWSMQNGGSPHSGMKATGHVNMPASGGKQGRFGAGIYDW